MAVSEKSILDKVEKPSLAEELRKELGTTDLAFNAKYTHKEDLESLLKLAEELKEKCDFAEAKGRKFRYLQLIFLLGSFYLFLSSIFFGYSTIVTTAYDLILRILFIVGGIVGLANILLYNSFYKRYKKIYLSDKLALEEVLQLLRETSNIIAEQEEWSVLSRAEFRIRLSRFNLEEKSKSAFNFFS